MISMSRISRNIEDYRKVSEASYLVADQNVTRYRIILRFFFVEHERMRDYLYPNEIFDHVKSIQGMEKYEEQELKQDLESLVKWKNIVPTQEVQNPRTIAEFNKKSFRYQISPYTVQIERMLIELERIGNEFQGSLDKRPFEKLLFSLRHFLEDNKLPLLEKWTDLIALFKIIRTNTADYLAYISSTNAEEQMQKDSFLVYKDKFVAYLRDFIVGSHQTALKIQLTLQKCDPKQLEACFCQLSEEPEYAPRFEQDQFDSEEKKAELYEIWDNLMMWFLDTGGQTCEYTILQRRTDEAIKKITRNIRRLGERHQRHISRKQDYLHLAKWFAEETDLMEAHKRAALTFGIANVRHYFTELAVTTDMYAELWDLIPDWIEVKPRLREYREKTRPTSFVSNKAEETLTKKHYLLELKETERKMRGYVSDGKIDISKMTYIDSGVRKILLRWVSAAMLDESKVVRTEFGNRVIVQVDETERINIHSDDGVMNVPKLLFTFDDKEGQHGG